MNIFTKMHNTREGVAVPIISMEGSHLINTVNLFFKKFPLEAGDRVREVMMAGFAPDDMPDKIRRTLGLRKVTKKQEEEAAAKIEEVEVEALERAFEKFWPYVIVGICRNDTREAVVAILQEVSGIDGKISLPNYFALNSGAMLDERSASSRRDNVFGHGGRGEIIINEALENIEYDSEEYIVGGTDFDNAAAEATGDA